MRICEVAGCDRKHCAKGLCYFHYLRVRRYGSIDLPRRDPEDRFWPKVDKSGNCWIWTASVFRDGYGPVTRAQHIRRTDARNGGRRRRR